MSKGRANWKQIIRLSAVMHSLIGLFMLIPTAIAVARGEWLALRSFAITLAIIAAYVAIVLPLGRKWSPQGLSIREVYLFVTITWVIASALGALPLYLSGTLGDFPSAFMEIMSGFTTTGLTSLVDIESQAHSILFWRSLTHWIGGMGIVVLFVALLPLVGTEGSQLYGAEAVGPTKSKLTPKIRNTASILWLIYVGFTVVEAILLLFGGLSLFDALTVTFGTMATGGFAVKNASIGGYHSPYVEVVVTVFMVLAGINFSLYFLLLKKHFKEVWQDGELRVYLGIFLVAACFGAINLYMKGTFDSLATALRQSAFHIASIMTTTGFSTTDYGVWPAFNQGLILMVMFIGGSSGSTGGGIKVTRIITMFKLAGQSIRTLLHPKGVFTIQSEHEKIAWKTVNSIAGFIILYLALVLAVMLVVASAGIDLYTSFAAALISVGNIGLGLGGVGPAGTGFSVMPSYVKWVLSFAMLAGRLEIYTVFALFTRSFWKR
jgi:trk system potassium uptake protein TrkH